VRKALVRTSLTIIYFLIILFLPEMVGGERDPDCKFNMVFANCCFAFILVGLIFLTNIVNVMVFCYDRHTLRDFELDIALQKNYFRTVVITFLISLFGYGGWFCAVQSMWPNFNTTTCLQGWNLLDFVSFIGLQLYTAAFAAMLALAIICCPCCTSQVVQIVRVLR
jgi:hypothetical protein